ncbi:response regulator [Gammaproteobacteria bacterium]|nr:response regulator [Gammaproteobacteria bacterium]
MVVKILVVDDEPDLESLMMQKFRHKIRQGEMNFLFANNGEDALSQLGKNSDVDIVISDINMPIMDGLTLLRRLQELDNQLRAVIVSAYGDMSNIRTAMNLGAFDFVTKPIDFSDLELTINKTISDLQSIREIHRLRESAEKAKLSLSRYFSPNLVQQLVESPDSLNLDGERRELTFVFTDLADFTPLVEVLAPSVIVPLLNEYLDEMTKIVFRWGGTVDKVVGDAVHAIFGAPLEQPDHAARGIACAMEIDQFAEVFRKRKNTENIPLGVTRIGVHTGLAIVGNFGGEQFFDYTAHGDAINTAARLEGANKYLGTRICVSERVVGQIPDFTGRPIGTVLLPGKTKELNLFEPLTEERAESSAIKAYQRAFSKLEAGDSSANQAFAAIVGEYGDDPLATYHLKRTLAGESGINITLMEK